MAKLVQHLDSEDIQLLEAVRGFVDSRIAAYVAGQMDDDIVDTEDDVPFDETDAEDVPAAGNNVWTRQELDVMGLKDLRQLAKDLGFVPKDGGLAKKTDIFDYLEKNKRIVDEDPDDTDTEDGPEDEENEEDDGVSFEDLLDKEKFPFKDLLKYADENEIEIPDSWREAKASNRRKIARALIQAMAEDTEDEE